jgi:hypothetical protein
VNCKPKASENAEGEHKFTQRRGLAEEQPLWEKLQKTNHKFIQLRRLAEVNLRTCGRWLSPYNSLTNHLGRRDWVIWLKHFFPTQIDTTNTIKSTYFLVFLKKILHWYLLSWPSSLFVTYRLQQHSKHLHYI